MGSRRSQRTSSSRHLSDDFVWDSFPTLPEMTAETTYISPVQATGFSTASGTSHEEEPKLVLPSANLDSSRAAKSSEEQQGDSVIPAPPALSDGGHHQIIAPKRHRIASDPTPSVGAATRPTKTGSDPTPLRQSAKLIIPRQI
ncbi:hypothetical protein OS493_031543 [Desmophyllum pertusum]|uniref:Uncharacterized protein n=1 Tax=Desmophyllum pertusum TaxID=174260 RepID=A0A9X0CUX2_9CNID|nr:hypothetical protein OS493_031543 [Desmophyllum pertusum]